VKDRTYYQPTTSGHEAEVGQRLRKWWDGVKRYESREKS